MRLVKERNILFLVLLMLMAVRAGASPMATGRVPLERDQTYEQDLRYESSADQTVTPAKVIRWIMGLRGQVVPAPRPTEFQPIVNAHDGHIRLIAAIAFKF
jgi:hypothetical protein